MLQQAEGYTLMEMLVVMVIVSILTHSALVGYPELKRSMERNAARQQVEFDVQRTRAEALAAGARAVMRVASSGKSYTVGIDEYPYSSAGATDTTLFTHELPSTIGLSSSQLIIFNSAGYLVDATGAVASTTLQLADETGDIVTATVYPIGSLEYN